jgi:hypothetical protein
VFTIVQIRSDGLLGANQPEDVIYPLNFADADGKLLRHTPRKIANMVGVTDNTVRSQIESIFSKIGVKRQGELIRLLLNNSGLAIHPEPTL